MRGQSRRLPIATRIALLTANVHASATAIADHRRPSATSSARRSHPPGAIFRRVSARRPDPRQPCSRRRGQARTRGADAVRSARRQLPGLTVVCLLGGAVPLRAIGGVIVSVIRLAPCTPDSRQSRLGQTWLEANVPSARILVRKRTGRKPPFADLRAATAMPAERLHSTDPEAAWNHPALGAEQASPLHLLPLSGSAVVFRGVRPEPRSCGRSAVTSVLRRSMSLSNSRVPQPIATIQIVWHSMLVTIVAVLACDPGIEVFPADPDGDDGRCARPPSPRQRRRVAACAATCTINSAASWDVIIGLVLPRW